MIKAEDLAGRYVIKDGVATFREEEATPKGVSLPESLVGLDPGFQECGMCALQVAGDNLMMHGLRSWKPTGAWRKAEKQGDPARLRSLFLAIRHFVHGREGCVCFVESVYFRRRQKGHDISAEAIIIYGQAVAACVLACEAEGHEVHVLPPDRVKELVCGSRKADKDAVLAEVERLFGEVFGADSHLADACGTALAGWELLRRGEGGS
jgi:Holliday junction resolvasome RuvABC endonuclease subunit